MIARDLLLLSWQCLGEALNPRKGTRRVPPCTRAKTPEWREKKGRKNTRDDLAITPPEMRFPFDLFFPVVLSSLRLADDKTPLHLFAAGLSGVHRRGVVPTRERMATDFTRELHINANLDPGPHQEWI